MRIRKTVCVQNFFPLRHDPICPRERGGVSVGDALAADQRESTLFLSHVPHKEIAHKKRWGERGGGGGGVFFNYFSWSKHRGIASYFKRNHFRITGVEHSR